MAQAGHCTGRYIKQYTYNDIEFNQMMAQGYSVEDVIKHQRGDSVLQFNSLGGCCLIYEYEVDGVIYRRAAKQRYHTKNKLSLMESHMGYDYNVTYNMDNPFESYIGERISEDTPADKDANACFILSIIATVTGVLGIPGIVLGIIALVKGARALKNKTNKNYLTSICMFVAGFAILFSIGMTLTISATIIMSLIAVVQSMG